MQYEISVQTNVTWLERQIQYPPLKIHTDKAHKSHIRDRSTVLKQTEMQKKLPGDTKKKICA